MPKKQPTNVNTDSRFRIKIVENGPYLVSGGVPLVRQTISIDVEGYPCGWEDGKKYPLRENYALCRCGRSRNKPFCDGTHTKVGFDGQETASRQPYLKQARKIKGTALNLTDAKELCAAGRFCDRAGGIWALTLQSANPEARRMAVEEAGNCPSGRLVVCGKDGKAIEPDFEPSIILVDDPQENMNGPIWVRGGIPIESADGSQHEIRNRVALCRCGKSSNKPFCDGSHCK